VAGLTSFGLLLVAVLGASAAGRPSLDLTLTGSVKGTSLHGKVRGGLVRCYPSGKGLELQWSGGLNVGAKVEQVSGDVNFQKTGKSTFGPKGTAIASLVANNDYSNRLGSGLPGGGGSATVAANRKSGTISVELVGGPGTKVQEQGSWVCG
jgi:hypothetical protein